MSLFKAMCKYVFLRLYAQNLARGRRSEPEAACSDAVMQTAMFVGLPTVSTMWIVASLVWPGFSQHVSQFDATFLAPSIGLGLLVAYWINSQFGGYSSLPHAADAYRGKNTPIIRMLFIAVPVVWVVLVGLMLHWIAGHR